MTISRRPVWAAVVLAVSLLLAACGDDETTTIPMAFDPLPDPEPGNWTSFRADPARTGYNPEADTGRTVRELWRVEGINTTDYGAAKGSPSVYGDTLYVGTDDARFLAIDRMTGETRWQRDIENTTQGIHGSPAITEDLVYIGAYNGTLYAFDRVSGEPAWEYQAGFQIGASPVVVPEHGRVYNTHERSAQGGGIVVCVDARTGAEVWQYQIRAHPHSSVALHRGKNLLFVGDNLAKVHAFDVTVGQKVWEVTLAANEDGDESDIKTTPTVIEDKDMVVVGAWSKYVHAFDVDDGALLWEYYAGARIMGSTAYSPMRETVYVGSLGPSNSVHAIDVNTGAERWAFKTGGSVMSSPAVSGDESLVVVGSHDGNVYALDATDGSLVWQHRVGGVVSGSPALVGNHVYITAKNGDLVALETGQ